MSAIADSRRARSWALSAGIVSGALVLVGLLGALLAITGADFACLSGPAPPADAQVSSRAARHEIPPARLALYQAAGERFDVDWAFLAAIGAQECGHRSCAGDNGSGCAGPMQIAVRRGSPCSPGSGPTLWERFGADAGGDGRADVNDPADAIFTAARILREAMGAPAAGGSFEDYRQAACRYYGACANRSAAYADEVMARAARYGFSSHQLPSEAPDETAPVPASHGACAASTDSGVGGFGAVYRVSGPGRLEALPAAVTAGAAIRCDARIVADVIWLARRYRVQVAACFGIHARDGEHPLGAATDLVPEPGEAWQATTERLARDAGWDPSCAASGVAPGCARAPFRFIAYNGYRDHGDPEHCQPCPGGAHLHLSWQTSASPGQRENRSRDAYFPASWIDVFDPGALDG